ncbi:hypothetical protein DLM77_00430 [Leptospira yasudae]|uniref:DUF4372 domain-containing protein n=1 Tax=Leptospira yasudae TaxID=2202201 RepID=A0ABX9M7I5_9LEPT|nr:hypothetical protein DLM77_00430 [Leptospira yasudae]
MLSHKEALLRDLAHSFSYNRHPKFDQYITCKEKRKSFIYIQMISVIGFKLFVKDLNETFKKPYFSIL